MFNFNITFFPVYIYSSPLFKKTLCHLIIESLCLGHCAFDLGAIKRTLHPANATNSIGKGSRCRLRRLLHAVLTFALVMNEIVYLNYERPSNRGIQIQG